jgi:hypothetical protein
MIFRTFDFVMKQITVKGHKRREPIVNLSDTADNVERTMGQYVRYL